MTEKMTLQELLDEDTAVASLGKITAMSVPECLQHLEWNPENSYNDDNDNDDDDDDNDDDDNSNTNTATYSTGKIICSCGEVVCVGGWFGIEHAWCPRCHKGMQDLSGFLPEENSGFYINPEKVELNVVRRWIPVNMWRF
jgi:hypothetical protein